jgi:acetylornithine/succinyldiaminopimelate/putrescine aminotransferase
MRAAPVVVSSTADEATNMAAKKAKKTSAKRPMVYAMASRDGKQLGIYSVTSKAEALDKMAKKLGYKTYRQLVLVEGEWLGSAMRIQ